MMGTMKVLSITGITLLGGFVAIALVAGPKSPEERVADTQRFMAEAAETMKGERVHRNVVFDGYEIDGNSFTYNYTLTHISDGRYSGLDKVRIERQMHEQVCRDRKMKRFLKADGVIRYAYRDSDGEHLFVVGFDDAICGLGS